MGLWKNTLWANFKPAVKISINSAISQGNTPLPLPFCIGRNPLIETIKTTGYGYQLRDGDTISHPLHMDDIKVYAKRASHWFSEQNHQNRQQRTPFGIRKCGWMVRKRGQVIHTEGIALPEGRISDVKRTIGTLEYQRQIATTTTNGKNKVREIKS